MCRCQSSSRSRGPAHAAETAQQPPPLQGRPQTSQLCKGASAGGLPARPPLFYGRPRKEAATLADTVFCSWPLLLTLRWVAVSSTMPRKAAASKGRGKQGRVGQAGRRAGSMALAGRQRGAVKSGKWLLPRAVCQAVQGGRAGRAAALTTVCTQCVWLPPNKVNAPHRNWAGPAVRLDCRTPSPGRRAALRVQRVWAG